MKTKEKSILFKTMMTSVFVIILALFIMLAASILSMKEQLVQRVNETLVKTTIKSSTDITNWVGEINFMLKTVKNSLENIKFPSDAHELQYLMTTTKLHDACPYGIYGGDANGFYEDGSGWIPDADYVVTERDWYKDGVNNDEVIFGMPYLDAQTGEMIVSASVKLNRTDRNKMVIAADVFLTEVTNSLKDISVLDAESGELILVDTKKGTIISHENIEYNGYEIKEDEENELFVEIKKLFEEKENTVYERKLSDGKRLITKNKIPGTNWELYACVKRQEAYSQLVTNIIVMFVMSLVCIAIAAVGIAKTMVGVTKPINDVTQDLTKISGGNLTLSVSQTGKSREIRQMNTALASYVEVMKKVITDINKIASELEVNAGDGINTSESLSVMAHEQNTSVEKIQENMNDLVESMREFTSETKELFNIVENANSVGTMANKKMVDTVDITGQGHKDMMEVQRMMKEIVNGMKDLASVVKLVEESTSDITSVMDVIEEMASQTNLLSLNASIEAARAGEAGRGFAIVASEIGRLADESTSSAHEVNTIIEKITNHVHDMIEKTQLNVATIENNVIAIDKACDTFESIEDNVRTTSEAFNNIINNIKRVDEVSNTMMESTKVQTSKIDEVIENMDTLTQDAIGIIDKSKVVENSSEVVAKSSKVLVEHMKFFEV